MYTNDVIPLVQGLDLVEAKSTVPNGSLAFCRNYEITDKVGLHRIDGYERFDGRMGGETSLFWRVTLASALVTPTVGDVVAVDTFGAIGSTVGIPSSQLGVFVLGTVVEVVSSTVIVVGVLQEDLFPVVRDNDNYVTGLASGVVRSLYRINKATKALTELGQISNVQDIQQVSASPAAHLASILAYKTYLRSNVGALPGPAVMTYIHKGTHFAACGVPTMRLTGSISGAISITSPVNTTITNAYNGATGRYLGFENVVIDGVNYAVVYYQDLNTGSWTDVDGQPPVQINGLAGTVGATAIGGGATLSTYDFGYSPDKAVIFYSGDEQEEASESFYTSITGGWQPMEMGYTISFNNGSDSADYIRKYERGANIPTPGTYNYWISDGSTTFTCDLLTYKVTSGAFTTNNAVGTMTIANVVRISGSGTLFGTGYSIYRTATISAPNKVADFTTAAAYNFLPGVAALQANKSRYMAIDYNFYSVEDSDAIYVATGASKPFWFERNRLAFIDEAGTATEYPRHVERLSDSLAFGYANGLVRASAVGEPWNFSGLDGAYEAGMGYPVRGMLAMAGDTLGVFCSNGVFAIQGTNTDNYQKRNLLAKTGAVEYTVVALGGDAVFCSHAGVVSLSQSDKYGDFVGEPISYKVTPLIRPKTSKEGALVVAIPVRVKNQYRVFAADGTIFTFTFKEGQGFQPTTQGYYVNPTNYTDLNGKEFIPLAISSVLDHNGEETILASHYSPTSREATNYVYKLDSGWGFDGKAIKAEADINWYFAGNPFINKVLRKVRIDGVSLGKATLKVTTSKDYENEFQDTQVPANLPRQADYIKSSDTPYSTMANVAERGFNIGLKVVHEPTLTEHEPPHTLQALFVQFTGAKTDA